jgi:hypothetical protein
LNEIRWKPLFTQRAVKPTSGVLVSEQLRSILEQLLQRRQSFAGVFAPPLRPPDLLGRTSRLYDGALIGAVQWLTAAKRRLDEPWFQRHPRGLPIGVKFLRHSQWYERRCDGPGFYNRADNDRNTKACAGSFPDLLEHHQTCARCAAITFNSAFSELQQERLGDGSHAGS